MTRTHWQRWHEQYDDPASALNHRLAEVQRQLGLALDSALAGPLTLVSLCAGRGRDVLDVLASHERGRDVRARLVELDPTLADDAETEAQEHGLTNVEVVVGDAAMTDAYESDVPADIVMVCGVFGNISADDIARTISIIPSLCAFDARVIWTRHRRQPDMTGFIRSEFRAAGFSEIEYVAPPAFEFTVGTHQLERTPDAFVEGQRMFTFYGDGDRPA